MIRLHSDTDQTQIIYWLTGN